MTETENRPSPEALLTEAKNEHRGKLKVFLGAAPGVGKTFAMLNAARSRLNEGVDTVIGIVETHQRSETQALVQGLEEVPRQKLDYRGILFDEMDIDAILARKPRLVLVDELAHTNIPGARHPKRYQDVQEILEAGIDVYSTLNVQHIESLNDIVTRITGVKVRETVPDNIVQMANSIELIDLPPDELLQRLQEGKVYIPEQARLAVNRFFTPGNLTALRELALRQAAERVDDQMTNYMRRHAIAGPWPTSNRIMVCISDDQQAVSLVRTARRSAERRQAPWLVLYIESSRHSMLSERARNDIAAAIEMAQGMGAETLTVTGEDISAEILRVARERNVSTIIIGKSVRSLWSRLTRPSVAAQVLSKGDGFDILLVNNPEGSKPGAEARKAGVSTEPRPRKITPQAVGKVAFVIGLSSLVAFLASRFIEPLYLPPIFIIAVLLVALDIDLIASLSATFIGGLVLDIFMTWPHFAFFPRREDETVSLLSYMAVALTISIVGDRLHRQIRVTSRNAERTQALYDFTKTIAAAATIDDVVQATVRRVALTLGARAAVLLPKQDRLEIVAAVPADLQLDTASNAAMDWAWQHHKPAGWRSDTLPGAAFYGLPLHSGTNTFGVLALQVEDGTILTSSQNHFLISLAYQAASALERVKLVSDIAQARLQTETEKLHTSLLSSISRDLRVPLDSIIMTARTLANVDIPAEQQRSMISHIQLESDRLDRFVENLLDMTEIVTGGVRLNLRAMHIRSLIDKALQRLARRIKDRTIHMDVPADLPALYVDGDILRRVFINVIENACSYSSPDKSIEISARRDGNDIQVIITDHGHGIPESERQRVFDMFYRIKKSSTTAGMVAGAGLGLSICRGFVEAHHGTISAQAGEGGVGTSIIIRLPITDIQS